MRTRIYLFLLALALLLVSCEKSESTKTTDQSGNVVLVNDSCVLSSYGIKVSIENTNFSTLTDSSGNWILKGVNAATQTIVFEKSGFGTYKQEITPTLNNQNYLGDIKLPEIPKFSIKNLTVNTSTGGSLELKGEATNPPQFGYEQNEVVFISKTSNISGDPSTWSYCPITSCGFFETTFTFSLSINYDLYQNGFSSGSTLYFVSYGTSCVGNNYYYDATTKKTVFGCLSSTPSNIVSIQLP